ncbi:hypothetical protein MXD61_22915 [Frankia sp. AgPm24]|nr:hypothetical protein [Frankia sp. AgPm24]
MGVRVIDKNAAAAIAVELQGRRQDDAERPWELEEFPEGWLIVDYSKLMGAPATIIERSSGRIMHFPSYVPPGRIVEEYGSVLESAWEGSVADFRR